MLSKDGEQEVEQSEGVLTTHSSIVCSDEWLVDTVKIHWTVQPDWVQIVAYELWLQVPWDLISRENPALAAAFLP